MLDAVTIAGTATYGAEGQALSNLRAVNFIFGTNGSGKTTISRAIGDFASYPACQASWRNGRALECLVFNSDFARKNYTSQMAGIFTLGEQEQGAIQKVEDQKRVVDGFEVSLAQLQATLGPDDESSGKRAELKALRGAFEEECWKLKTKYDATFKDVFTGLRASKEKFCDALLQESASNASALLSLEELKRKVETVFAASLVRQQEFPAVDASDLLRTEAATVLAKRVIGKEDVDIAGLIRKLGNSDWVRQGLTYLPSRDSPCPFCQRQINDAIYRELNDYFDKSFINDASEIQRLRAIYQASADSLVEALNRLLEVENRFLHADAVRPLVAKLQVKLQANKSLLEKKEKEPSAAIALEPVGEVVAEIEAELNAADVRVAEHNALIDNILEEQARLKGEAWKFLLEEFAEPVQRFSVAANRLQRGIEGLSAGIATKRGQFHAALTALAELEKQITSEEPTVTAINRTLASFGFTSFRLKTAGSLNNLYEIVRSDGADAVHTLSEGEKSFITFLYFFHLLRGSHSASGVSVDRIVVFDDPVSSLDSDVLFVVSALIKQVLDEAVRGNGNVKQVFILTHNIYFHKEVSFDPKRSSTECRAYETFWIVRKSATQSTVTNYGYNPIKTSYELLWGEVRNENRSNLTIQNTLRRIIESYFKLLGNLDKDDIIAKFDGKDQQICASLFAWVNDGSHSVHDDLYITQDDQLVARYLRVFREIFEKTEHGSHYRMMMGGDGLVPPAAVVAAVVANGGAAAAE